MPVVSISEVSNKLAKSGYEKSDLTLHEQEIIRNIITGKYTPVEASIELNRICESNNISPKSYFGQINEDLKQLSFEYNRLLKEEKEVEKLAKEVQDEFKLRNTEELKNEFVPNTEEIKNIDTRNSLDNYYNNLLKEKEMLANIKSGVQKEKQSQQQFHKDTNQTNLMTYENQLKEINETAEKNIKTISNPNSATTRLLIEEHFRNQSNGSKANIEISNLDKDTSTIKVELFSTGNKLDEQIPKYVLLFSREQFYKEGVYDVIEEYVGESSNTKVTTVNNNTNAENENGSLKVALNVAEGALVTGVLMDEIEAINSLEMEKSNKNKFVRVRTMDSPYGQQAAKANIFIILLTILVVVYVVMLIVISVFHK